MPFAQSFAWIDNEKEAKKEKTYEKNKKKKIIIRLAHKGNRLFCAVVRQPYTYVPNVLFAETGDFSAQNYRQIR